MKTRESLTDYYKNRERKANAILANSDRFKVCEGCESLIVRSLQVCPNCKAYRFNTDPQAVITHTNAMILSDRRQQSFPKFLPSTSPTQNIKPTLDN